MTEALLFSWDLRPVVALVLGLAAFVYLAGWRRLRAQPATARLNTSTSGAPPHRRLAAGWRLATYWGGLATVAISLMSPVDVLSSQLFAMHMIQHLLLTMLAVPLLLIGNPFPVLVWGLPAKFRPRVSRLLSERSRFRRIFARMTSPGIAWLLYVIALIGWHDPMLYDLALRNQFVHDLQHLSFFLTTALLWWHILGVAPRFHRTLTVGQRILYAISMVPFNMALGVVIAFATTPIYTYYLSAPRLFGLTVLQDQMIAGILMWIPGSEMFFWAALLVLTQVVRSDPAKPAYPSVPWLADDSTATRSQ